MDGERQAIARQVAHGEWPKRTAPRDPTSLVQRVAADAEDRFKEIGRLFLSLLASLPGGSAVSEGGDGDG